jgi:hypothetical protein
MSPPTNVNLRASNLIIQSMNIRELDDKLQWIENYELVPDLEHQRQRMIQSLKDQFRNLIIKDLVRQAMDLYHAQQKGP